MNEEFGGERGRWGATLVMVPDPPSKGEAISHEISRFNNFGLRKTNITEMLMYDAFSLLLFSIVLWKRKSREDKRSMVITRSDIDLI